MSLADLADTHRVEPSGPLATQAPVRASDADRHATVLRLQDAVAAGRLTPGEGSQRMATASPRRSCPTSARSPPTSHRRPR